MLAHLNRKQVPCNTSSSGFAAEPKAPRNLTVRDLQSDSMTVTWEAPEFDGGSEITRYVIVMREEGKKKFKKVGKTESSNLSYTITSNIEPNTPYHVRVYAENIVGVSEGCAELPESVTTLEESKVTEVVEDVTDSKIVEGIKVEKEKEEVSVTEEVKEEKVDRDEKDFNDDMRAMEEVKLEEVKEVEVAKVTEKVKDEIKTMEMVEVEEVQVKQKPVVDGPDGEAKETPVKKKKAKDAPSEEEVKSGEEKPTMEEKPKDVGILSIFQCLICV